MTNGWSKLLVDQLEFYWDVHLWPRLTGLDDDEYYWQPVPGCWSVRPGPDGLYAMDGGKDDPPPVTTIAWRMAHIASGVLGNRANAFFGDDTADAVMFDSRYIPQPLPGNAPDALAYLRQCYSHWHDGIAALDDDQMAAPLGPKGGPFAKDPMAALVLHISREVMHHGGEIGVLRDLYRRSVTR